MKSGQILILVLLAVVVVLAVGLSVASRNITNLRTATQSEQSQRAFSAAEGGVENVLAKLGSLNLASGPYTEPVDVGGLRAQVTVVGAKMFVDTIPLGNVGQVDLDSVAAGKQVKIEWANSDKQNEISGDGPASIEITQVYGSPPYSQARYFAAGIDARPNENVKSVAGDAPLSSCVGFSTSGEYKKCAIVATQAQARILRIKPFWADTTVRISGDGFDLPIQTYDVTSTATTDIGVTRRVQVTKTALPQLPAVFDYVLYSESDIKK